MTVTVKALTEFQHGYMRGRLDAITGGEYRLPAGEADELVKAGFVEILPAQDDDSTQTGVTDSQGVDDLVGGDKADTDPENKMEKAPANKGKTK